MFINKVNIPIYCNKNGNHWSFKASPFGAFFGKKLFLAIGSPVHPSPGMPSNAGDMGRKGTAALIL